MAGWPGQARHDKYMGGQVYVDAERVKKANEALLGRLSLRQPNFAKLSVRFVSGRDGNLVSYPGEPKHLLRVAAIVSGARCTRSG